MTNKITVTMSKIMAFCILFLSVLIDFCITKTAATFMYAVPFCCSLIGGKQVIDYFAKKGETQL